MRGPTGRRLGSAELTFALTHEAVPFVTVGCLEIDGELEASTLRGALDDVQSRHGLLRARIVRRDGERWFDRVGVGPIPLAVLEEEVDPAAVVERELNTRIDAEAGPLARCTYLRRHNGGHLVLTFHHSAVDGLSSIAVVGELLASCAGGAPAKSTPLADEPLPRAVDDLIPESFRGAPAARRVVPFVARQIAESVRSVDRGPPSRIGAAHGGVTRFVPLPLATAASTAFRRQCRERRVLANAALLAAMLTAVQRVDGRAGNRRSMSFVDLRPYLEPPVDGSVLGFYASSVTATAPVGGDVWELADVLQGRLHRAAKRGDKFVVAAFSSRFMRAAAVTGRATSVAAALSYVDSVPIRSDYGRFRVEGLFGAVSSAGNAVQPRLAAFGVNFGGRLHMSFMYSDAVLPEPAARATVGAFEATLHEMAGVAG